MSIQLIINGNLGQSFELKSIPNSNNPNEPYKVLNFSIASSQYRKKADGSYETISTEWVECEYWGRDATHAHGILQKGMPVILIGEEKIEQYTNKNGESVRARKMRVEKIGIIPNERITSIAMRQRKDNTETSNNPHDNDDVPL